jgi:methionyl-tRNA formyltransferase
MSEANPIRVVFMGTPALAATVLTALLKAPGVQVVGVVAQPDKPVGRKLQLTPPPVKVEALAHGLPVWQPLKARDPGFLAELQSAAPDVLVVAAYGQLLPPALLAIPPHGCLNVHTSLLPRWRGAAPIQWALAEGDAETGVTLMLMEAGLDTGPRLAEVRTRITDDDTGQTLHDRLAELGATLVVDQLRPWVEGRLPAVPQPSEGVTYARKITREDGRLDFTQPARHLWRRLRAFTPWPGAFCEWPSPAGSRLLKVHRGAVMEGILGPPGTVVRCDRDGLVVACGEGGLVLQEVQLEGGKRLTAEQFSAGHRPERFQVPSEPRPA